MSRRTAMFWAVVITVAALLTPGQPCRAQDGVHTLVVNSAGEGAHVGLAPLDRLGQGAGLGGILKVREVGNGAEKWAYKSPTFEWRKNGTNGDAPARRTANYARNVQTAGSARNEFTAMELPARPRPQAKCQRVLSADGR